MERQVMKWDQKSDCGTISRRHPSTAFADVMHFRCGLRIARTPLRMTSPRVPAAPQKAGARSRTQKSSVPIRVICGLAFLLFSLSARAQLVRPWAWGDNEFEQVGFRQHRHSLAPKKVTGLTGLTAIASGAYHNV